MTDANDRAEKIYKIRELIHETLRKNMHERSEQYRRAGFTITQAVVDQVFEETEQKLLKDRDQWEEDGLQGSIAFIERELRDPLSFAAS